MSEVVTAHWYDAKGHLQEFRGTTKTWVHDGALFFNDNNRRTALIVAPGDWHEVTFDYEDDDENA